jgi:hypothetical protein
LPHELYAKRCAYCDHSSDEPCLPETSPLEAEGVALEAERDRIEALSKELAELRPTDRDYARREKLEEDSVAYLARRAAFVTTVKEAVDQAKADIDAEFDVSDAAVSVLGAQDVGDMESLIYVFPHPYGGDDIEVVIDDPKTVEVYEDGTHYIIDADGDETVVPPGWFLSERYLRRD